MDNNSPSPAKKLKIIYNYEPTFEEQLSLEEEFEASFEANDTKANTKDEEQENPNSQWSRPQVPDLNALTDSFSFQQIDLDYYTTKNDSNFLKISENVKQGVVPIIRLYGVTKQGNSVCCHIHGFSSYVCYAVPPNFSETDCEFFKEVLNNAMIEEVKFNADNIQDFILAVEIIKNQKSSNIFLSRNKYPVLKISVVLPKYLELCMDVLKTSQIHENISPDEFEFPTTSIDFITRFTADTKIVSCCWVELVPGKYEIRGKNNFDVGHISRCQLEVDAAWDQIVFHNPVGEWDKMAPFRVMSFDIECMGRQGKFPDPQYDSIIQISNMVNLHGENKPIMKNIFTLNTCDPIKECEVISEQKEIELLKKWRRFVLEVDPDIITGFNFVNFDIDYLTRRAAVLGILDFSSLGRIKTDKVVIQKQVFKYGKFRCFDTLNIQGRLPFDIYFMLVRHNKSLKSYKLDNVSRLYLNDSKAQVHHSQISVLQKCNSKTRRELAIYCLKDTELNLQLYNKFKYFDRYFKKARKSKVRINDLINTKVVKIEDLK